MTRALLVDNLDAPPSRFDIAIESLLILLLAFMPAAFGAVHARSELLVVIVAALLALCLAIKHLLDRDARFVASLAYLPLALFLLLIAGQLLPMPASFVHSIAPNTVALKSRLLCDLPDAHQILDTLTLSFYPPATRQMLRVILIASVVLVVVANVYRRPRQIKRLLASITIIGCVFALLSLAQDLSGTTAIYWSVPLRANEKASGGPFVNHNNFAQFMNLSIGAAIALLLVLADEKPSSRGSGRSHHRRNHVRSRAFSTEPHLPNLPILITIAAIVILAVLSIFLSGSRGGMLSFLIAFTLTTLALASRRDVSGRAWLLILLGLGIFVALLYAGFDVAYTRLATLRELEKAGGGRWQINKDVLAMLPQFLAFGIGLGAHELVYPMFSRLSDAGLAGHVENEYLQLIEEAGLPAAILAVAFLAIIVFHYLRVLRRSSLPIHNAALGLGFGLMAVLAHSTTDFGQRIPANACLSAVFGGLLIAMSRAISAQQRAAAAPSSAALTRVSRRRIPFIPAISLVLVLIVSAYVVTTAYRSAAAESHWADASAVESRLAQEGFQSSNEDFAELLTHASAAADAEPDNVQYRHWLNVYRWYAVSRMRDPDTQQFVLTDQSRQYTERIVRELQAARALCPTFGPTCCVVGQLQLFVLSQPAGENLIRAGYNLAPTHPTTCFVAGRLDANQGRFDESLAKLRRAVALGHPMLDALEVLVREVRRPDLALDLAADDVWALFQLAKLLETETGDQQLVQQARDEAANRLKAKCAEPNAAASVLASTAAILAREKDYTAAAEHYRRALARDYGNVAWRLELARALRQTGQIQQAMHETRVCLRLRPQLAAAQKLLGELSVLPGAGSQQ